MFQGCAAGPYKPVHYDVKQDLERLSNVVVLDKELDNQFADRRITIVGEKSSLTEDGRIKVLCEIRNMKQSLLRLQVQTVFKDESDFSIEQDTPWELVLIPGFSTQTYSTTALNVKAKKYTIRIREAR
jgi:hypothetical protein